MFSGIVVKDIELLQPEKEEAIPLVTVKRAEVDAAWRTAFDEVFSLTDVTLYQVEANVNLNDPMTVLYCLSNRTCLPTAKADLSRGRLGTPGTVADVISAEDEEVDSRKPLLLQIESFSVESGTITLLRNQARLVLEIAKGRGENVFVPLKLEPGSIELDVFAVSSAQEEVQRLPLRIRLHWSPEAGAQTLEVTIFSRDLPLALLTPLFPELFSELSAVRGKLSGKTVIRYAKSSGWQLGT